MDVVRVGRVVRALRRRRGWRQLDLAGKGGVSQSLIARIERGGVGRVRIDTLDRIAAALDGRLVVRIDWLGEAADRLLDADHAEVVEQLAKYLRSGGWEVAPEVTFSVFGERGSIDILARHPRTATLLVVEVKTVVPDLQGMLATFDRKVRHADGVARARGWRTSRIWSVLAISDTRTSRRRVHQHEATVRSRFPHGSRDARRLIAHPEIVPDGAGAGMAGLQALWFVPIRTQAGTRQRIPKRAANV